MLFFNKWLTLPESESPFRPLLTNGSVCRNRNRFLHALLTNGSLYAGMTGRKITSIANKKTIFGILTNGSV
jgi:hypothetical protein